MPPPVSYIDVTELPFTRVVTTAEFNVSNEIWFRVFEDLLPEGCVLGVHPNHERAFSAACTIFASNGSTALNSTTSQSRPLGWPVEADTTYYVRIRKSPSGSIGANFTASFDTRPYLTAPFPEDAAILVNDDTGAFPAAFMDREGNVVGYKEGFDPGEFGAKLPNGRVLMQNNVGQVKLYDANLEFEQTLGGFGSDAAIHAHHTENRWYVVDSAQDVYRVESDGSISLLGNLGETVASFGVSDDESRLWYTVNNSAVVREWHINTASPGPDLVTLPNYDNGEGDRMGETINGHPNGEILVVAIDRILVWWQDAVEHDTHLVLVATSSGAVVDEWVYTDLLMDHLQPEQLEPEDYVYAWLQDFGQSVGTFGRINLATGALEDDFEKSMFSSMRNGSSPPSPLNDDLFGPSQSCFMLLVGGIGEGSPAPEPEPGPSDGAVIGPYAWVHRVRRVP